MKLKEDPAWRCERKVRFVINLQKLIMIAALKLI